MINDIVVVYMGYFMAIAGTLMSFITKDKYWYGLVRAILMILGAFIIQARLS